jgi:hypothetical protein
MSDENERSVASVGSVAERPLGDPEVAVEILRLRVAELEEAIRRLAEQDATLSLLCKRDGSQVVTVTMDATLTDEERRAIKDAISCCEDITYGGAADQDAADVLKALLERTK